MSEAAILTLVSYALKYGIPAVQDLIVTLKKPDATIADVEAMFAKVKTYDQYNIPNLPVAQPAATIPS